MNNIYHFHSRKELYGKNVNIYRKEKSNKEYFKYSNVMYDVKNYKKIKLAKSNINFKRGGVKSREVREAREEREASAYGESLRARLEFFRIQRMKESDAQREVSDAKLVSFRRSLNRARKQDGEEKRRTLTRAYYRVVSEEDVRPKNVLGKSRESLALDELYNKKRRVLLSLVTEYVNKDLDEES